MTPRHISTQTATPLHTGWHVTVTLPGAAAHPDELAAAAAIVTVPGVVPGTVVSALRDAGSRALAYHSPDDFDVWYVCDFEADAPGEQTRLVFEGLATLVEVWLNGESVLQSENMYLRHEVDVSKALRGHNTLCLRFGSLNRSLEQRRPRPRWRTKLVDHAQLRWVRTTLTGRMPGWHEWAKCIHAVGPWRPISLVTDRAVRVVSSDIRATVEDGTGRVTARVGLHLLAGAVSEAVLHVGNNTAPLAVSLADDGTAALTGTAHVPEAALWWPHTHGAQPLYPVRVTLTINGQPVEIDLGRTGFRTITVDHTDGKFAVRINGVDIFLRGACWTAADAATLMGTPAACDKLLRLAREAGMNMLRIPGNGFYESDAFYDRCAELGITVWQDFAFALMDYPATDPAFTASVADESKQILGRLQANPALTVLCGNSECAAAAAMHGLTADDWASPLFDALLPELSAKICPGVPYVPSSQWGGALPFHVDSGVSHAYGLGAYRRPPDDVRRSGVRFATECLGFSNVPEQDTIDEFLASGESPGHHPSWNAAVPRNVGLGWDFGDVTRHYAQALFGEDLNQSMFRDSERFLALSRAVSGELMTGAFAEWRRPGSSCAGALVWLFRDLWPGAGWGIIDSANRPKSVFYSLKRALAPRCLFFSDEGLSGLRLHLINERPAPLSATLQVSLFRHGHTRFRDAAVPVEVEAQGHLSLNVDALLGSFLDTTYAYQYGPPGHDVVFARLTADNEESVGEQIVPGAFYFPTGLAFPKSADLGLRVEAVRQGEDRAALTVTAERFAQSVHIDASGWRADDNYFHLEPGGTRTVCLSPERPAARLSGTVTALNALTSTPFRCP